MRHTPNNSEKMIHRIPVQIGLLALFFVCYHFLLYYIMRETALNLGAVRFERHILPLYAEPNVTLTRYIIPALLVCIGYLWLCHKRLLHGDIKTRHLLWIAFGFFIAINITIAQLDGYRSYLDGETVKPVLALLEPYTRASLEYYGDVPRIQELGLRTFLHDYSDPALFDTLSGHTRTHPPGGVVFLWLSSAVFGYNLLSASLVTIIFTALTVVPIYRLGEYLYGERVARYALLLFLILPNFVMFTGTSMDGPFSVFPILSIYLFYKARYRESLPDQPWHKFRPYSLLTGLTLALGMFMTYSTVVIGVFFCVVALLERHRFRQYLKILLFASAGFIGFYLLLFLLTGFQPIESLWAAIKKDEAGMGTGYESIGRYFHLSFANLFAFLIGIGLPITTVWFRHLIGVLTDWRESTASTQQPGMKMPRLLRHDTLDAFMVGFALTLLFFTFSTLFTMEVERIWIFMAPFFVIPVAKYLTNRPKTDLYWVAVLLTVQLILGEVLLYTYW